MRTQHCVRAVFTSLTAVDGIVRADVTVGAVEIEHDGRVTADQLRAAIAVAGYELTSVEATRASLPIVQQGAETRNSSEDSRGDDAEELKARGS
jgi:copper chaperone CopZ